MNTSSHMIIVLYKRTIYIWGDYSQSILRIYSILLHTNGLVQLWPTVIVILDICFVQFSFAMTGILWVQSFYILLYIHIKYCFLTFYFVPLCCHKLAFTLEHGKHLKGNTKVVIKWLFLAVILANAYINTKAIAQNSSCSYVQSLCVVIILSFPLLAWPSLQPSPPWWTTTSATTTWGEWSPSQCTRRPKSPRPGTRPFPATC